jgi:hypothetical protein
MLVSWLPKLATCLSKYPPVTIHSSYASTVPLSFLVFKVRLVNSQYRDLPSYLPSCAFKVSARLQRFQFFVPSSCRARRSSARVRVFTLILSTLDFRLHSIISILPRSTFRIPASFDCRADISLDIACGPLPCVYHTRAFCDYALTWIPLILYSFPWLPFDHSTQ